MSLNVSTRTKEADLPKADTLVITVGPVLTMESDAISVASS
jgi:hypothetical protein